MGTPKLWCNCKTCKWARENNFRRRRFSILLDKKFLIDVSPDIKEQLEYVGPCRIEGIFVTHAHYDHIAGIPELPRVFKTKYYASKSTAEIIKNYFSFLELNLEIVESYKKININDYTIIPFEVAHPAPGKPLGYLFEKGGKRIAITGDTKMMLPQRTLKLLKNVDLLIIDMFTHKKFNIPKHMNLHETLKIIKKISPKNYKFIHISHQVPPEVFLRDKHYSYDFEKIVI